MSKWTRANPLMSVPGYKVPAGHFANGYTNGGDRVGFKKGGKVMQDAIRAGARDMAKTGRGKKFRQSHFKDKKTGRTVLDTDRNRERYGKNRIVELKGGGMAGMRRFNRGGKV